MSDSKVNEAKNIPIINDLIEECRQYRLNAGRDAKKAARRPHAFCYSTFQERPFICVGNTIGADVQFIPADLYAQGTVISH
ncbi:type IIL restriction-modification enzyme MmeI, partial [Enterococcus faecalis]|uniref:type IIL restriction-modification enzyme MmeI n=1 Tax=Enterococcus faecalis TaxID=1351 RepID=UPI00403F6687